MSFISILIRLERELIAGVFFFINLRLLMPRKKKTLFYGRTDSEKRSVGRSYFFHVYMSMPSNAVLMSVLVSNVMMYCADR